MWFQIKIYCRHFLFSQNILNIRNIYGFYPIVLKHKKTRSTYTYNLLHLIRTITNK